MTTETTVLLVDAGTLPSSIEEQLGKRDVFVEHTDAKEVGQVAPVLVPDLIVQSGNSDLSLVLSALEGMMPRPAYAVLADRATIRRLRADAHPQVGALIPQDLPLAAIAHRITTMARRSAEGKPIDPLQTTAKPAAQSKPASQPKPSTSTKPEPRKPEPRKPEPTKPRPSRGSLAPTPLGAPKKIAIFEADSTPQSADDGTTPPAHSAAASKTPKESEKPTVQKPKVASTASRKDSSQEGSSQEDSSQDDVARKKRAEEAKRKAEDARKKRAEVAKRKAEEAKKRAEARRKEAEDARKKRTEAAKKRAQEARLLALENRKPSETEIPQTDRGLGDPPPPAASFALAPESESPTTEDEPARGLPAIRTPPGLSDDEFSVVAPLPVEMRLPLSSPTETLAQIRLAFLDTDLTRADSLASALRRKRIEVFPVTPEVGSTRWPLLRRFAPQGLVVDEKSMARVSAEWVETFRGDPFLRHVPLVVLRYSVLFKSRGDIDLDPLLRLIEPLGHQEHELLNKLAPARQVDLKLSQITPYRLVQLLTGQDKNTRLDCRAEGERIVWPLGPGYAGRAKLLQVGSEKVVDKLSPEDSMSWLLLHEDCDVTVVEHDEPLAHPSESKDSEKLLFEMTEVIGRPHRHRSGFPEQAREPISSGNLTPPGTTLPPDALSAFPGPPQPHDSGPNSVSPFGYPSTAPGSSDVSRTMPAPGTIPAPGSMPAPGGMPAPNSIPAPGSMPAPGGMPAPARLPGQQMQSAPLETHPGAPAASYASGQDEPIELPVSRGFSGPSSSAKFQQFTEGLLRLTKEGWERYVQLWAPLRERLPEAALQALIIGTPVLAGLLLILMLSRIGSQDQSGLAEGEGQTEINADASGASSPDEPSSAAPGAAAQKEEPERGMASPGVDLWQVAEDSHLDSCETLLGPAVPKGESPDRSLTYWKQARKLLMRGDTEEALKRMCLAGLFHTGGPAAEGLAEYYLSQRSLAEAERWVKLSLDADPERRKSLELMGDIESQKGNSEEARKIWLRTMRLTGEEKGTLHAIAKKLMRDANLAEKGGDLPRAERKLRRAATLDPENAEAATRLAEIFLLRERENAARVWAERATTLDPNYTGAIVLSGRIAEKQGRREEAMSFYESVPPGDPQFKTAQSRLSRLR